MRAIQFVDSANVKMDRPDKPGDDELGQSLERKSFAKSSGDIPTSIKSFNQL